MTVAISRDEGSRAAPAGSARRPWVAWLMAALLLMSGGFGLFVRHAPPTVWAVPVQVGPLVGDRLVWALRRSPSEVRVEVGTPEERATVRLVDRRHPDRARDARVVGPVRVEGVDGPGRAPTAAELDAVAERVAVWTARRPRPPAFVGPLSGAVTVWQRAEQVLLEVLLVAWLAAMVAVAPALAPHVRSRRAAWLGLTGVVVVQQALIAGLGLHGVWHSNHHGFDRIADVAHQVAPSKAALALLHGMGFYAVYQPLAQLTGLDVLRLAPVLAAALVVAVFLWLRALWDDDGTALAGAAFLAALPAVLRLGATETMYLPASLGVVLALWLFELHLRTRRPAWLVLGLGPAFLAMQTRAELMALLPAWVVLLMLARDPGWLRDGWRHPAVPVSLLVAAAAFAPRLHAILHAPPPAELRRSAFDPLADPRLLALAASALLGLAAWPPVRRRLPSSTVARLAWGGAASAAGLAAYALAVRAQGGPLERTWQLHAAFDPALTAPWWSVAVAAGGVWAWRRAPGHLAFLATSWALAMWLYLPQLDCLSTYVRTSLATSPLLAALAAPGLAALAARPFGVALLSLALAGGVAWGGPWLSTRYPRQQVWELVREADARIPEGAVLVWASEADVPERAIRDGFRTTRARLDRWLPERRVIGLRAWLAGEAGEGEAWLLRTLDCQRPLLRPRDSVALAGEREVAWSYLDVSRVSTAPRVRVELPEDWLDPLCARVLVDAETVIERRVGFENAGSIYEQTVGEGVIGLYRLPPRGAR